METKEKPTELGLPAAKELLVDWTMNTTFHGIRNVTVAASWYSRILWGIMVFFFTAIMCIQVFDICASFNQHQWTTTVFEENSGALTEFPTVTVCSYNRLQRSEADRVNLTNENMMYLFDKVPTQSGSPFNRSTSYFESVRAVYDFVEWKRTANMTTKEIFQNLSPECDELIDFISGDRFVLVNCSSNQYANFSTVFTTEFGQCYQVTFALPNKIVSAGKKQGVTLLLNAQVSDYLNFVTNNYMDQGFALQVHYGPRVVMGQWLTVAPGFHYNMGMNEHQNRISMPGYLGNALQFLRLPFTSDPPCLLEPHLKYNDDNNYSREQCLLECSNDLFAEHCGCLLFVDSPVVRMCEAEEVKPCNNYLLAHNISLVNETCMEFCKDPCSYRQIETSYTFSRFPSVAQLENVQQLLTSVERPGINPNLTLEQIREEYALVDIYFERLEVLVVERREFLGLENLISTCGGLMGLWVGVSIVTVFEAIAYLLYGVANVVAWPWKKTKKHVAPHLIAAIQMTLQTLQVHPDHNPVRRKKVEEVKNDKSIINMEPQRYRSLSNVE